MEKITKLENISPEIKQSSSLNDHVSITMDRSAIWITWRTDFDDWTTLLATIPAASMLTATHHWVFIPGTELSFLPPLSRFTSHQSKSANCIISLGSWVSRVHRQLSNSTAGILWSSLNPMVHIHVTELCCFIM